MLSITTINVNGIRAAARKGLTEWLSLHQPDALCLQEVRATPEIAAEILTDEWEVVTWPCDIKGRAGVSVAVRKASGWSIAASREGFPEVYSQDIPPVDTGRWLEADLTPPPGCGLPEFTLVSAYLHSGETGTVKQDQKMAHFQLLDKYLPSLAARPAVVCGDFNVVRSELDIKNWKPNHNKTSGVLDEEIAYLDKWMGADGWSDVVRELRGDEPGPYSWWSWRGKAFDNDAGWRIDYQMASAAMRPHASEFEVYRAESYDSRFSDHAPLTVKYS